MWAYHHTEPWRLSIKDLFYIIILTLFGKKVFCFIPGNSRVIFLSAFSLIWLKLLVVGGYPANLSRAQPAFENFQLLGSFAINISHLDCTQLGMDGTTNQPAQGIVSALVLLCCLRPARLMWSMSQQADLKSIGNSLQWSSWDPISWGNKGGQHPSISSSVSGKFLPKSMELSQ